MTLILSFALKPFIKLPCGQMLTPYIYFKTLHDWFHYPLHVLIFVSTSSLFSYELHWSYNILLICLSGNCYPSSDAVPSFFSWLAPIHPLGVSLNTISSEKPLLIPNLKSLNSVTILFTCLGCGLVYICSCVIGDVTGFLKINKI